MRFPGDSVVKNPPADAGDAGDSGLIDPREDETATHSSIPAGKSPWSLAGYSLWGCEESDMTE